MKSFFHEEVTLESIERQVRVISLESSVPSQLVKADVSRVPGILSDIKKFISTKLKPFSTSVKQIDYRTADRLMRGRSMQNVGKLGVYVPSGFSGKWDEYIKLLSVSQSSVENTYFKLLVPFEKYLSIALTNPDKLKNLTVPSELVNYKSADVQGLNASFAKFFTNNTSTEALFEDVVENIASIAPVVNQLNVLNREFAKIDRAAMLKRIDNIDSMLNMLIEGIKENPDEYEMSSTNVRVICEIGLLVAREVEFYTIHGYFLESFTTSVGDSISRLQTALGRS